MKDKKLGVVKRLEALLFAAGSQGEKGISISQGWQAAVIGDIRRIGPLSAGEAEYDLRNSIVWRFSFAAGICIVALVIYTLKTGLIPMQDLAMALLDDPIGMVYTSIM